MRFLYTFGVRFYGLMIRLAAPFSSKAAKWVNGRKQWKRALSESLHGRKGCIWVHCASLGEFEQGRPVIEAIRANDPDQLILLTFFSPSGYEVRKNYSGADVVAYMPLDTPSNAAHFIDIAAPRAAIFVKYEFWYNHLAALSNKAIPTLLISGVLRPDHLFFRFYGAFARKSMRAFTSAFLQDSQSLQLAQTLSISAQVAGDTRFDRVVEVSQQQGDELLQSFCEGYLTVMVGSSWPAEEEALAQFMRTVTGVRLVLVPHETDTAHIAALMQLFPAASRYTTGIVHGSSVLIVDTVGLLSRAYRYCDIAVIGGGFGKGIHNILEAAVYGKPVVFGPRHQKFHEAAGLLLAGGAFSVESAQQLDEMVKELVEDEGKRHKSGTSARDYVFSNTGATQKIMSYLIESEIIVSK